MEMASTPGKTSTELQTVQVVVHPSGDSKGTGASRGPGQRSSRGYTPYKRTAWDYCCLFVLSPQFQCALQLVVGIFIVALFVFVRDMRFLNSCLSATLYIVCSVLVSPDNNVGTKLLGCSMVVGATTWGAVLGGCVVSFARVAPDGPRYTAFLCCLSVVVLAFLAINRVGANPPFLWVLGMVSCLSFGLVVMPGQRVVDRWRLWHDVVGYTLLDMAIGAGVAAVMGLLVVPSFAADELRRKVAHTIRGIGHATSRYASRAFMPEEPSGAFCRLPGYTEQPAPPPPPQQQQEEEVGAAVGAGAGDGSSSSTDDEQQGKGGALRVDTTGMQAGPAVAGADGPAVAAEGGDVMGRPMSPMEEKLLKRRTLGGPAELSVQLVDGDDLNDDAFLEMLQQITTPAPPPQPRSAGPSRNASRADSRGGKDKSAGSAMGPSASSASLAGSTPGGPPGGGGGPGGPPVAALRPVLARARQCMGAAGLEPPFLLTCPFSPPLWGRVLASTEVLLTRVAALECVLEERNQVAGDATLECFFHVDIVPQFRRAYALIATTCATMSHAIEVRTAGGTGPPLRCCPSAFGLTWQTTKENLRADIRAAFGGYWRRVRGAKRAQLQIIDAQRMRGLMFLWTITNGIIDAMEDLEQAVKAACFKKEEPHGPAQQQQQQQAEGPDQMPVGESSAVHPAAVPAGAGAVPVPGSAAAAAPAAAAAGGGRPGGLAGPAAPPPTWFQATFGWAIPLVMVCLGLPLVGGVVHALAHELPQLKTGAGWRALLSSRVFQSGVKYWLALSTVLVLILGLSANEDTPEVARYRPVFGYVAAVLSMSERVEATVSKVFLWVLGTAVGGTLGYVAMIDSSLATNPYGLMAIVCAFTFLVGLLSGHQFRVGIVLTLMTFNALILCQYKGCCGATGTKEYYAARVLAVILGTSVPVLITNLILPWFNADWALEVMGGTFKAGVGLVTELYTKYYYDGCAAYESKMGSEAMEALKAKYGAPPRPQPPATPPGAGSASAGVPKPAGPSLPPLQARVALPLVGVQVALAKDATVWARGVLATPKIVMSVLHAQLVLLDRLAALALVINSPASVEGHFSGWAFEHIVLPLHGDSWAILEALHEVAAATACVLTSRSASKADDARKAIAAAIEVLEQRRLQVRNHVLSMRQAFHHGVRNSGEEELPHLTHPDDAVRVFSFIFAWIKMLDKATVLARTALRHKGHSAERRESMMAWMK